MADFYQNLRNSEGVDQETYKKYSISEAKKYMERNRLHDRLNENRENKVYDKVVALLKAFNLDSATEAARLVYNLKDEKYPDVAIAKIYGELAQTQQEAHNNNKQYSDNDLFEILKRY